MASSSFSGNHHFFSEVAASLFVGSKFVLLNETKLMHSLTWLSICSYLDQAPSGSEIFEIPHKWRRRGVRLTRLLPGQCILMMCWIPGWAWAWAWAWDWGLHKYNFIFAFLQLSQAADCWLKIDCRPTKESKGAAAEAARTTTHAMYGNNCSRFNELKNARNNEERAMVQTKGDFPMANTSPSPQLNSNPHEHTLASALV